MSAFSSLVSRKNKASYYYLSLFSNAIKIQHNKMKKVKNNTI